jgi:hypothetical protein
MEDDKTTTTPTTETEEDTSAAPEPTTTTTTTFMPQSGLAQFAPIQTHEERMADARATAMVNYANEKGLSSTDQSTTEEEVA